MSNRYHLHPDEKRHPPPGGNCGSSSRNAITRISNSLDQEFYLDALEMTPEDTCKRNIFHSNHGCQFTQADVVAKLQAEKNKISCSGRKRGYDNLLVERL